MTFGDCSVELGVAAHEVDDDFGEVEWEDGVLSAAGRGRYPANDVVSWETELDDND